MQKSKIYFCVKSPKGELLSGHHIARTKDGAINNFIYNSKRNNKKKDLTWEDYTSNGYSVVRVELKEIYV